MIDAASDIATLLTDAPALKVLATSREALRVTGERVMSLSPLALPDADDDTVDDIARSPAVALFTERARAVKAGFSLTQDNASDVAAICRRLDGLPLAIELAAARVNLLSPSSLLSRLDRGLKVLSSGRRDASQRQRTLRAAIAWSYDLLSADEQRLFYRLGVFAGGFNLEAAEKICDRGDLDTDVLDGLASLVDKSLVRTVEGQDDRFFMLETIRSFATDMLKESGEREETRRAHAEFFHALAVAAEPHTVEGSQQARWLRTLEVNHDNLRAALTHLKSVEDADGYRSTASALAPLWRLHGHLSEGRRWLVDALASTQDESVLTTKLLTAVGLLAYTQGDYEAAEGFLEESLSLSVRLGVAERVRASLNNLGTVAVARGDHDGARVLFERSMAIARKNDDELGVAYAAHNLADLALNERDFVAARDLAMGSYRLWEELGDVEGRAGALTNAGLAAAQLGDLIDAGKLLVEALSVARDLGSQEMLASCLDGLAVVAVNSGKADEAARLLGAAERLRAEIGATAERFERELHDHTLSVTSAALSSQEFLKLVDDGRSTSPQEVVMEALGRGTAIAGFPGGPSD